jgi:hypothetical protein
MKITLLILYLIKVITIRHQKTTLKIWSTQKNMEIFHIFKNLCWIKLSKQLKALKFYRLIEAKLLQK